MKKLLPIIALVALLGQGCPTPPRPTPPAVPPTSPPSVEAPAPKMGFGKLPALQSSGVPSTPEAMSGDARSALS
ncbi:MAG: hypothetical protein NUW08_01870, partial [Candidatus Uhrbacteria bacterium]|nr:hypothetical protein [Candidatus Uhrbacteria bacterium]